MKFSLKKKIPPLPAVTNSITYRDPGWPSKAGKVSKMRTVAKWAQVLSQEAMGVQLQPVLPHRNSGPALPDFLIFLKGAGNPDFMWNLLIFTCWHLIHIFQRHSTGQIKHIWGLDLACVLSVCKLCIKVQLKQITSNVQNRPFPPNPLHL